MTEPVVFYGEQANLEKYYVGVKSHMHTLYSITVQTQIAQGNIVNLLDGIQHSSKFSRDEQIIYYQFEAKLLEMEELEVHVKGGHNQVVLYVNTDGFVPSPEIY